MSNLIKTGDGKLIKYTTNASFHTYAGFTTSKPLPTASNSTLSEISPISSYYGQVVTITNGEEFCSYTANSNNTFTPAGPVSLVTDDAVYIASNAALSWSYAGKYYLRSTKTWSDTVPIIDKLIKIN